MQLADRDEFDRQLSVLCAGFNVPATKDRKDAYWEGLTRMTIASFSRAVQRALGEDGPDKIPTPKQCWSLSKHARAPAPVVEPSASELAAAEVQRLGYEPGDWQLLANRIGIRFCRCFHGDKALSLQGWQALRRIAGQFEVLAADSDPEATPTRMQSAIVREFRHITGVAA